MAAEVRCPRCGKKLGEDLVGVLTVKCRGCKAIVVIDNTQAGVIKV